MKPSLFLGIDPGRNGGIARVAPHSALPVVSVGLKRFALYDLWVTWFQGHRYDTFAVIERPNPGFPGPHHKSDCAKLWGNFTELRALLVAAGIPYREVTAHRWQKVLGIPPREKPRPTNMVKMTLTLGKGKTTVMHSERQTEGGESYGDFKRRLKAHAQKTFPQERVTLAVADAMLIAEFARREHG